MLMRDNLEIVICACIGYQSHFENEEECPSVAHSMCMSLW